MTDPNRRSQPDRLFVELEHERDWLLVDDIQHYVMFAFTGCMRQEDDDACGCLATLFEVSKIRAAERRVQILYHKVRTNTHWTRHPFGGDALFLRTYNVAFPYASLS